MKKTTTISIVTLTAFAGVLQSLANASGYAPQTALYHKTSVQQSYSVCPPSETRTSRLLSQCQSLPLNSLQPSAVYRYRRPCRWSLHMEPSGRQVR